MNPEKFDSNPIEQKINKPKDGNPDTNLWQNSEEIYTKQQEKLRKISDASDLQWREDQKEADSLLAWLESDTPQTSTPDKTDNNEDNSNARDDYDTGNDEYINSDGEYFV